MVLNWNGRFGNIKNLTIFQNTLAWFDNKDYAGVVFYFDEDLCIGNKGNLYVLRL